jgi:hypothetical protein
MARSIRKPLRICCAIDRGYITWDLADHYGPAGTLHRRVPQELLATRGQAALDSVRAFTEMGTRPQRITWPWVDLIDVSLRRMQITAA